jgi:multidrug efflux pump
MTSAATVFGHLPLVLASGPGSAARNSIGMVLVTGMTVGTLFTLFVVPVFYSLIAAQHQPSLMREEPDYEEPPFEGAEDEMVGSAVAGPIGRI